MNNTLARDYLTKISRQLHMENKTKNIIKFVYLTRISCPRVPSIADSIALRGLCSCHPVAAAVVVVVKGCRGSRWKIGDCSNVDAIV